MNFKLDLKKFKKIHSDKHTTTMRHENGHEIKIAHNSLSPKMRGELAAIPAMADGGEVAAPANEYQMPAGYENAPGAKQEEGLEAPAIDPIDFLGAPAAEGIKLGASAAKAGYRAAKPAIAAGLEAAAPVAKQFMAEELGVLRAAPKAQSWMQGITDADVQAAKAPLVKRTAPKPYWETDAGKKTLENGPEIGGGRAGKAVKAVEELPPVAAKMTPEQALEAELARQRALKQATTIGEGPKKMAEGGDVNQANAAAIQKGATSSGWNPEQWAKNIKEGLKMADGGQVPEDEMNAPEPSMGRNPMTQVEAAPAPQQQPTIIINNGQQPNVAPQQPDIGYAQHTGNALRGAIGDARDAAGNLIAPVVEAAKGFKQGFIGGQQAEAQKEIQQGQVPAGLQQPMPEGPATTKPLPPAPGPEDPYGTKAAQDVFNQGFGQKLGGIQEAANLAGKVAKQNEAIYNEQLQKQAEVQKQFQENYKKYQEDHDNIMHDIQANHISPDNYWKDHSKLLTGLGIILAGFNPSDKPNAALDFLNKQMERNLDAQKAEMGKRNNLLSALQHQYGDSVTATTMFNTIQRGMIADKLQQIANQNGGAQAQATAKQLAGELKMQNAQQIGQNAMRATMLKSGEGAPGNNPDAAIQQQLHAMRIANPAMAKEIEARYIPNVGMASIPVPEKVRATIQERKVLGESIGQLMDFQKKYGGTLAGIADPQIKNQGEALAKQVQDQYRRANDQGVFKESEAAFVNGVIADSPSSLFSKYTKAQGYKTAAQINQQNLNAAYSAVGLKPFNGNAMPAAGQSYTPKTFKPSK